MIDWQAVRGQAIINALVKQRDRSQDDHAHVAGELAVTQKKLQEALAANALLSKEIADLKKPQKAVKKK